MTIPQKLVNFQPAIETAACGSYHSIALDCSKNLWSWGWNLFHQAGFSDRVDTLEPKRVNAPKMSQIACGYSHSVAITELGVLWTWGSYNIGFAEASMPEALETSTRFLHLDSGGCHITALDEEANLWGWGWNEDGQLCFHTDMEDIPEPQIITAFTEPLLDRCVLRGRRVKSARLITQPQPQPQSGLPALESVTSLPVDSCSS
jgi:alpha-tubulin suppressor-like RCC1 family protein